MPSSNKTNHLKLNHWAESDRPMRNDFNADNTIIDQTLGGHVENDSLHVTSEEKAYLQKPHSLFMYSGNGESSRSFAFTEKVNLVLIYAQGKPLVMLDSANSVIKSYSAMGSAVNGCSAGMSISASALGVTVTQGSGSEGFTACLNESGVQYKMILIN